MTLPALAHRPTVVTAVAAVGLGLTFGSMVLFDAFPTLAAFPTLDAAMTAAEMLALCAK